MTPASPTVRFVAIVTMVLALLILGSLSLGSAAGGVTNAPRLDRPAPSAAPPGAATAVPGATASSSLHPWSCHGLRMLATPSCGGPARELSPKNGVTSTAGWSQINATPPPQAAYDFEMAYDASDGYVVLFGSSATGGGSQGASDLWTFANYNWTPLHPAVMPENCPGSMLAYDSHDGYVVYLGSASTGCTSSNQTWTYHAGIWTQVPVTSGPAARFFGGLVDDPSDGYLLLFGGESSSCTAA